MLNNRKKTIGVFVCKLPEYFQRTLCGALADEAVANGYNLVVFSTFGEFAYLRQSFLYIFTKSKKPENTKRHFQAFRKHALFRDYSKESRSMPASRSFSAASSSAVSVTPFPILL